jgi:phosphotriesterase-related protein
MGTVETVRGPVAAAELGPALLHEHIFISSPEGVENFNHAWGAPWWDEEARVADAVSALRAVRELGIGTVVDPTAFGLSRNVRRIARVNEQVDLHIVVCSGVYAFMELPGFLKYRSADDLAALFIRELREGIDDTGIRAAFLKCAIEEHGVIGDIPLILDAIATAALETGAPVMVHTNAEARTGLVALAELSRRGVDPTRIVIAHAGDTNAMDYLRELAGSGAMLGLDRFNSTFNTDEGRIETLLRLLGEGFIAQLHLSHDGSTFGDFIQHNAIFKDLRPSYLHIHQRILPALRAAGVTQAQIDEMLVTNAQRFLAAPQPA